MTSEELDKFEQEADRITERFSGDVPVSETRLLSHRILEILVHNVKDDSEVEYSTKENTFNVRFSYVELKMGNGEVGLYEDIPDDFDFKKVVTLAFLARGFHRDSETEVRFADGKMILNRDREHKHLIDFQRAVMLKGES